MVQFKHHGNFNNTEKFLKRAKTLDIKKRLDVYGTQGVRALASATPVDTGKTAKSWGYEIKFSKDSVSIIWTNSNTADGIPIAVLIQYGHGTRNGGFIQGRDFINPALQPIFDKITEDVWREIAK